ncbi:hypothetical protein KAI87_16685 [Myxococcota bacterium]|nr:hypothetical protein [Myxococcota bacterium]
MKYFVMAMIASLTFVGCDSDDDAADPVAFEDLSAAYAAGYCTWIFSCCDTAEIAEFGIATEAACLTELTGELDDDLADIEGAIGSGAVIYDADDAGTCMAAIEAVACGDDIEDAFDTPACETLFRGTVAAGSACVDSSECAGDDSWCDDDVCVIDTETIVAVGGSCADGDAYCDDGLFCNDSAVCAAMPVDGEECNWGNCAAGFACDTATDTCGDPLANGIACGDDGECVSDYCDWDTDLCADEPAPMCDGI